MELVWVTFPRCPRAFSCALGQGQPQQFHGERSVVLRSKQLPPTTSGLFERYTMCLWQEKYLYFILG